VHFPHNPLKCWVKAKLASERKELPVTDEYMTEQEQIEQLKKWLKEYGSTVILGIVISVAGLLGWHYWEGYHTKTLFHASNVYDELIASRAQNQVSETTVQANKLWTHYPKTPYAKMAAFILARDAIASKNYPEAIKQLNWVLDHAKTPGIREIARIRIARILITQKKANDALDILKNVESDSFVGLVDEIRGDAYSMLNDKTKAKQAYQLALQELPKEEVSQTPLLQIKLDNLITASDSPQ
jgi:predicted negative regulator of RcsB-dependent stress response